MAWMGEGHASSLMVSFFIVCCGWLHLTYQLAGEKTFLTWFRGYMVVVSREPSPAVTSSLLTEANGEKDGSVGETGPSFGADGAAGTVLTLYDLKNKFVAFSGTFGGSNGGAPQTIKSVLGEWGELFVITQDKKVGSLMHHAVVRSTSQIQSFQDVSLRRERHGLQT